MPSPTIKELIAALAAAGIDHSTVKERQGLEDLCLQHGLAKRQEVRPVGPVEVCTACRKPLAGAILELDGKRWHKGCLVCRGCRAPLTDKIVMGKDGLRRCEPCGQKEHRRLNPPSYCSSCNGELKGRYLIIGGRKWHKECCKCACGVSLEKEAIQAKDGTLTCASCATAKRLRRAPRCAGCGEGVLDGVKVNGHTYHRACVTCEVCCKQLMAKTSTKHRIKTGTDKKLYCHGCLEERFGLPCASCAAPMLRYTTSKATDEQVCVECAKTPGCFSCHTRSTDAYVTTNGLRHCEVCAATVVNGDADAASLLREVQSYFRAEHGMRSFDEDDALRTLNVKLVDEGQMQQLVKRIGSRHGACKCPLGVTVSETKTTRSSDPDVETTQSFAAFTARDAC